MYDWLIVFAFGFLMGLICGWAFGWKVGVEDFKLKLWMDYDRVGRMYLYDTKGNVKTLVALHDREKDQEGGNP